MEDAREVAINKLSELLKHPDDLTSKVGPLTRNLAKEKASIDAQLSTGVQSQLDHVQEGLETLTISSRNINRVKENMRNIDKLCYDAQSMITDFPRINMVNKVVYVSVEPRFRALNSRLCMISIDISSTPKLCCNASQSASVPKVVSAVG